MNTNFQERLADARTLAFCVVFSVLTTVPAGAVVTVDGGASFSLRPANSAPFSVPSTIIDKSTITATGPSTNDAFVDNLLNDTITANFPADMWFNGGDGNGATTTIHEVTFSFDSPVDLAGVKIDWAWADRDDGVFEFLINGTTTSLGTFTVSDTPGGAFPADEPAHFLFDTVQTATNSLVLRVDKTGLTGNPAQPSLSETTFYTEALFESVLQMTVDRDTGNISLSNGTAAAAEILGYSLESPAGAFVSAGWKSIAENYDADGPNTADGGALIGTVDSDDNWTLLSDPADATDLSEFELEGGDGGTLTMGQSVNLGSVWRQSPTEDIVFEYALADDTVGTGIVEYTGNGDARFEFGDLNFDGTAFGLDDFTNEMLPNLVSSLTGTSSVEAYQLGDLDADFDVDKDDFRVFKNGYLAAGGDSAALAAALSVPEPASMLLLAAGGILFLRRSSRRSMRHTADSGRAVSLVAVLFVATALTASLQAQTIVLDAPTPLAGNQEFGGELGMDFNVVSFPIEVQSLGIFDSLQDGLMDAGTSIHVEIWDRNDGGTPDDPADDTGVGVLASELFTFGNDGVLDGASRFKPITALTLAPGSYSIVAGGFGGNDQHWNFGPSGGDTSGLSTINAAGGIIEFVGGARFGTANAPGNFPDTVDGGPANRYNAGTFEYLVDVDPLTLEVNTTTGQATILNEGEDTLDIDIYQISSDTGGAGSLNPNWAGLPGWSTGGASDKNLLADFNLTSSSVFAPSDSASIGQAFDTAIGNEDLQFSYTTTTDITFEGNVRYVMGGGGIRGDYNNGGQVEQGDLDLVLLNWGDDVPPTPEGWDNPTFQPTEPKIDQDDLDGVLLNWGNSAAAASAQAVPEPSTLAVMVLALIGLVGLGRRRLGGHLAASHVAAVAFAALLLAGSSVMADVTNDREFWFGEDALEGASDGAVVGSNNTGGAPADFTLDSAGPSGAFLDLQQSGDPIYVDVDSTGGLDRPGADDGDFGVRFDGVDDRLRGGVLNRPDELAGPTPVGSGPIVSPYPFNYDNITARGLQMWVRPDTGPSLGVSRQTVVMDSIAAGGLAITADGLWTQINDGHADDTGIPAFANVTGDTWYHVMHHVHPSGSSGAPSVIPGTGGADAGFTSVLYVDGLAVSGNNDNPAPGDSTAGNRIGLLTVGAAELPGDGVSPEFGEYFDGVVDDLELYVFGDNSGVASGPPNGQNYGTFDLMADNEWIATAIANTVTGGILIDGDINFDGAVTQADVTPFVANWKMEKLLEGAHNTVRVGDWETRGWGDFNLSGKVDLVDAVILHGALRDAGQGGLDFSLLGANSVPEPATCWMFVISCLGLCRAR